MCHPQKCRAVECLLEALDLVLIPHVEDGWKAEEKETECCVSSEHEQERDKEHIGENYIRKSDH